MLDVVDFIKERGGDPNLIRESQRRRHAPEEAVDEVIALYEDHRKSVPSKCPLNVDNTMNVLTEAQPNTKLNRLARGSMITKRTLDG